MTDQDLKKIRGVIKEELEPTNKKLDILWDQTVMLTEDMSEVKETLKSHSKVLKSHSKVLKSHSEALKRIEEQGNDNVRKLIKRVTTVERQLGISAPPELVVAE